MALADEFMKPKGESEDEEKGEYGKADTAAFAELRKRFLTGSDEEAQDAFEGMWALCEAGEEEEGESTPPNGTPALKIHIGGK